MYATRYKNSSARLVAEMDVHAEIPMEGGGGGDGSGVTLVLSSELVHPSSEAVKPTTHVKLGELATTAICGNDILSSVLYVCGELRGKAAETGTRLSE